MAASNLTPSNLTGENIESFTGRVDYVSIIGALTEEYAMDIKAFDNSELSQQYWLDTSHCITKTKRYNRKNLYSIIGSYSNMTEDEVKHKVIMEINEHAEWYDMASSVALTMKGINFKKWLCQLVKHRTMPDEVVLYALCVIYRRNALVFTSIRPWSTLKKTPNMTLNIVSEMCETLLLYLGKNLYGELHRRPFRILIEPKLNLSEIQATRPLFRDKKKHDMWVVVLRMTDYEPCIRPEEITEITEIKQETDEVNVSLFSDSYAANIKVEPDWSSKPTGIKIGHLTISPGNVSKEIKQELIDCSPSEILERHSSTCAVSQLVQHSQQPPDMQEHANPETEYDTSDSNETTILDKPSMPHQETLLVITPPRKESSQVIPDMSLPVVTEPVQAVTASETLPVVTPISEELSQAILDTSFPVVTEPVQVVKASETTLPVVTEIRAEVPHTTMHISTEDDPSLQSLPVVTIPKAIEPEPRVEKFVPEIVSKQTIEHATSSRTASTESTQLVVDSSMTETLHAPSLLASPLAVSKVMTAMSSGSVSEDTISIENVKVYKYYEIINIHNSEVIHLHHSDIMNRECRVNLTRITDDQISMKKLEEDSSSSTDVDVLDIPKKPKKRQTTRPGRKPSTARMASQRQIDLKKRGILQVTMSATTYPIIKKASKTVHASEEAESTTLPVVTKKLITDEAEETKSRKSHVKAVFKFRTIGLKNHQESIAEIKAKRKGGCSFKCITCGEKYWSVKDLNAHYKQSHESFMCDVCSRSFSSPFSLRKHMYTHRVQQHKCDVCANSFPFQSQLDSHMDVHTIETRLYCTEPKCSSSFLRKNDLKTHQVTHRTPEVKCQYCDFTSPDKRNVNQHERKHTGKKPYKCEKCLELFMYAQQKKRHKCQAE